MIGSIRKHSKWLWIVIAGLTIISFVVFMGSGPMRGNGGRASGGYGTLYGHPVTPLDYARAQREFYLSFWARYGQWPDKNSGISGDDMQRETYMRLLLAKKAKSLSIEISEDALVSAASQFLRSLGRDGQSVQMQKFEEQVLRPQGLTVADLQNFLRSELEVQQLVQALGLSGALVTPQEAGAIYDREHQELSAQAVFFSASNYLSQVSATPAAIAQYYTNSMAVYRQPNRVQVSYVYFNVTNYLAQAQAEWNKTNFTEYVNAVYQQYGQSQFPEAKTPDEAKAKIRELLVRDRAMKDARQAANDFAGALFAVEPVKPENLAALAKQKSLTAHTTAPFAENFGPEDMQVSAAFSKAAFQLNADEPFAGPIVSSDGIYVIALANQLPSSIPPLDQIRASVAQDYALSTAVELAQQAGAKFHQTVTAQMATGGSFSKSAVAAGHAPLVLPPFSLSTQEMTELGNRASLNQIKQAAFTTSPGHASNFVPTTEGGFVLFVQELMPINQQRKSEGFPQIASQIRQRRQSEAFNLWLQGEANRELRDTPVFAAMASKSR